MSTFEENEGLSSDKILLKKHMQSSVKKYWRFYRERQNKIWEVAILISCDHAPDLILLKIASYPPGAGNFTEK